METEVDINILIGVFIQKNALLQKENAFLEAKYQTLLKEYEEVREINNSLQSQISVK